MNSTETPGLQKAQSFDKLTTGSASPQRRGSQLSSQDRETVVHKISEFHDTHKLNELSDELANFFKTLVVQEQSLRTAHEKTSLEVFDY